MPDPKNEPDADEPDSASQLSRHLQSQIYARIRDGVLSAARPPEYYVVRSAATGVLSVLAASTLGDEQHIVKGPAPFAECIAFVNAQPSARRSGSPEEQP